MLKVHPKDEAGEDTEGDCEEGLFEHDVSLVSCCAVRFVSRSDVNVHYF